VNAEHHRLVSGEREDNSRSGAVDEVTVKHSFLLFAIVCITNSKRESSPGSHGAQRSATTCVPLSKLMR